MLLIDNDIVKRVLTMRECIEAQERAFAGTLTGASVSRPRIDMFVPCNREDGYYRWGSVEGASDGVLAVRLKSVVNVGPDDLGPDAVARMDVVIRQGIEALPIPEDGVFRTGVGHSHGAFVGGSPEEQTRLPKSSPKRVAQSSGPLYADVISGKAPGRTNRDQITQYRPVGNWGLQFSAVGAVVYRRAKEQGLGRMLPTEWFLQDIKN